MRRVASDPRVAQVYFFVCWFLIFFVNFGLRDSAAEEMVTASKMSASAKRIISHANIISLLMKIILISDENLMKISMPGEMELT